MRFAERVTFGGGVLDRDARLRADAAALKAALAAGRVWPLWRGKPLMQGDLPGWLPWDHPVFRDAAPPVYLGLADGGPRFAADVSAWEPGAGAAPVVAGFVDPSIQHHPTLDARHGFVELRGIMTRLTPLEAELAATARAVLQWHRSHGFCAACGAASVPVQGGWQRHCAACGAQHFPRTDPVVIMLVTRGNALLLGRSPGWPEGMFSLLAGYVEPGETLEGAVRREVFEETGVRCGAVGYLVSQPWPFPASLMLGMRTEALTGAITLDPEELEAARWVTREDLAVILAGLHPEIRPARPGAVAHFLMQGWLADRFGPLPLDETGPAAKPPHQGRQQP